MSDALRLVGYVCGALVTFVVAVWFNRRALVKDCLDPDTLMPCALMVMFWPLVAACVVIAGAYWILAHGSRLMASGMIAVEQSSQRRKERRALREKAGQEVFDEIDRMLRESSQDEVAAFMRQLKPERAA